ncbi:MAG TPA: selenocysteine-specific translation elongation factor [Candidatus Eremiobacteraceae bacterium]|nr:selenocysteine-specific translation elongation factor [Candidatus Eremiobacteraceae bacterium]
MHIVGTAGHVDHGKSALVISLTGRDPDRLLEERQRGMTLDLGFAPLIYDGVVEAGIIDVPGHERFLHNMLAGAAGMELLLLVVAATEGPKPQTREHLQILNFLNVQRALIVMTKADATDAAGLESALARTRDACRSTIAQDVPAFAVSNVTGAGVAELRAAIREQLASLTPRAAAAPAYLPIDRVFAMTGKGTIATGTLMQGTIRTGDRLRLQPSGIDVRVRQIQTFGQTVDAAAGGARVAVNLGGVDVAAIGRGETLAAPAEFEPARNLDVVFTPLPAALPMLRRRTPVRAHIGSAEIPGMLVFEKHAPRDAAPARAVLALNSPAAHFPGSRLVLRRMSPKDLLGGAVADQRADRGSTRIPDAHLLPAAASAALRALEGAGLMPMPAAKVAAAANVVVHDAESALVLLLEHGLAVALAKPREYLAKSVADAAFAVASVALRRKHAEMPWTAGCTTAEIGAALSLTDSIAARLLAAWHADGRVAPRSRYWHLPDFVPALDARQRTVVEGALSTGDPNPLVPCAYQTLQAAAAGSNIAGLRDGVEMLFATGALVRVGDDVYRRAQIERARDVLVDLLRGDGRATMARVRDAFGTSRKYALPLLEYFDGIGLTQRDGDLRRLRAAGPVA